MTALIFFAAFLAQTFSKPFVVADYYTNTLKYARNCENKARPQMHCNGKCQMMKKMQQEESKDQQNPERKPDNKNEIPLSSKTYIPTIASFCEVTISLPLSPLSIGKSTDRSGDIFHPPHA